MEYNSDVRLTFLKELASLYWYFCSIVLIAATAKPVFAIVYTYIFWSSTGRIGNIFHLDLDLHRFFYKLFFLLGIGLVLQLLLKGCVQMNSNRNLIAQYFEIFQDIQTPRQGREHSQE